MMFPTAGFPQVPMTFGFSAQQAPNALYQSQFGGYGGFNPQMMAPYQAAPPVAAVPPRGQSMPATARQYPQPATGPFSPGPSGWPRRQQNEQYPPPAPSQHYEHHGNHGSKSKRRSKRRSVSPGGAGDPGLYSDKERREASEGLKGEPSRSPSPSGVSRSKQEVVDNNQQQSGQTSDNNVQDAGQNQAGTTLGVARSEEEQAVGEHERRKSSSKKKKSHRRDRYEQFNAAAPAAPGMPIDVNGQNLFQAPYPGQPFLQQAPNFNEYQNELPPQLKVHRQPLYSGYTQAYEESIRRGDIFRKQAKRSTRLPPEVKQQLLPHEDDQQNQAAPQQHYPYSSAPGYPPAGPQGQPLQTFNGMRPPYNPYQTYGSQQTYYGQPSVPTPYNAIQPWSAAPVPTSNPSAEQEIQRLRSHIHTLEGELHKLQKKLNKTSLNTQNNEETEQNERQQQESSRSHRRSKRDDIVSPRQTPVIVELNSATGETVRESSKKHRRRTGSTASSQKGPNPVQQDTHSNQHVSTASTNVVTTAAATVEQSRGTTANATINVETEDRQAKVAPQKTSREETAAQLAHAAAAHVNARQATNVAAPPINIVGPAPPNVPRPQVTVQQQVHQQYIQQQVAARVQAPQIRGPAPRLPGPPQANIRFPVDPYRPPMPPQVPTAPNPNYNQSNNNELLNDDDEVPCGSSLNQEEQHRDAEKILDAFERFYLNRGKNSATPMKVKFIPEDSNSNSKSANYFYHGNTNNNNNRRYSTSKQSRSQSSSSSSSSSSESMYSSSPVSSRRSPYDNDHRKMASAKMDPCL